MGARPRKVLNEALDLTVEQRAELAARLIDSLDQKCDGDARSAWEAEIEKRIHELESGTVAAVPWPEARRQILRSPNGANAD
jgi:putative addiction module component (TIGR02574 family)